MEYVHHAYAIPVAPHVLRHGECGAVCCRGREVRVRVQGHITGLVLAALFYRGEELCCWEGGALACNSHFVFTLDCPAYYYCRCTKEVTPV